MKYKFPDEYNYNQTYNQNNSMSTTVFQNYQHMNFDAVSQASTDGDDNQNLEFFLKSAKGKNIGCGGSNSKNNKMKSSLCRNFSEKGYCPYGFKCQFAHGLEELRCNVDENSYKTKPCNSFWKKGCCPYGFRCNFSHSIPPTDM